MRKVVGLIEYKLHENDAKKDSDEDLFKKSVRKFVHEDIEGAKILLAKLESLKKQAKKENISYGKLVGDLFDSLVEGIEIKEEHREKFLELLYKNQITQYMTKGNNFIIPDIRDYKKAKFLYENLE